MRTDFARALLELEPHVWNGIAAIHVPETGIVDYTQVCEKLAQLLRENGHTILLGAEVSEIRETGGEVTAVTTKGDFTADYLVNCAGLHSDQVTRMAAGKSPAQIIPFRGEYFELVPEAWDLCRTLIYPVPDPGFPFLGVHFTRMINGSVECGPNAVLAFAREGYHLTDVNVRELWEVLSYPGFRKLAGRYWQTGLGEMWRSASKSAFVSALQRLVPEIRTEHLEAAPAGIRAQALAPDGALLDDFAFYDTKRVVNVVIAGGDADLGRLERARPGLQPLGLGRALRAAAHPRRAGQPRPGRRPPGHRRRCAGGASAAASRRRHRPPPGRLARGRQPPHRATRRAARRHRSLAARGRAVRRAARRGRRAALGRRRRARHRAHDRVRRAARAGAAAERPRALAALLLPRRARAPRSDQRTTF